MATGSHTVPNPATPRHTRPVELITDRAKRYRANAIPPAGPRRCSFCASRRNIDIDHIDGREANGQPMNLQYLCRSCNTRKGITQARAGTSTKTAQYNGRPSFKRYIDAVRTLTGDRPGNVAQAAAVIQATPPATREDYGDLITAARNPDAQSPTFAQYAYAVSIHTRGAHDEGGKIIHATPAKKRSEYAREIGRRKKKSAVPF